MAGWISLASGRSCMEGSYWSFVISAREHLSLTATGCRIVISNYSTGDIRFKLESQILSKLARELVKIANPPSTNLEYMKTVSQKMLQEISRSGHAEAIERGTVNVVVAPLHGDHQTAAVYKATTPGPG
jgi:hypothetical protein